MKNLDSRITTIREKINRAKRLAINRVKRLTKRRDNSISPFITEDALKLNPPIKLKKLIEIESQYEIKFPEEYRAFITKIANGGSGPGYSLFSLERSLEQSVYIDNEGKVDYSFLKTPFVHTSDYYPSEHSYLEELCNKCDRGEITDEEFDLAYTRIYRRLTAGTVIIHHQGCGYYDRLVVIGTTRGQIWGDGECSDQGYRPYNLSFFDWYEQCLDYINDQHQ